MKLSRKSKLYIYLLIVFIGILFIIFNENGLLKYMELKDKVSELQVRIDSLDNENKKLESEIDSLTRKIPAKIEQTARERYDMLRTGETKVEVIVK